MNNNARLNKAQTFPYRNIYLKEYNTKSIEDL